MPRHIPVYRPIIKHALKTSWLHRELWPLAAIAGLAGTGVVVNDVLNLSKLAVSLPQSNFGKAFTGLHAIGIYLDQLNLANPAQVTAGTVVVFILAVVAALLIAACQQVMLRTAHFALKRKTQLSLGEIRREFFHPRLVRFLTLDLLLKLGIFNLMLITVILVGGLNVAHVVSDAAFAVIFSAVSVSVALSFNIVIMLALVGIARKDMGIGESLGYGLRLYKKHALVCIEMSLLLFAINLLISAAYDGTIIVLGVPAALSFLGVLESGSFLTYIGLMILVALVVATVTVVFAGFATTFTYSAWMALTERLDKRMVTPRIVAHSKNLLSNLRS